MDDLAIHLREQRKTRLQRLMPTRVQLIKGLVVLLAIAGMVWMLIGKP